MKQLLILVSILYATFSQAQQNPGGFSYKVLITENGVALQDSFFNARFTIMEPGVGDVYIEEHIGKLTDDNGIASLYIGEGNPTLGDFSTIDWSIEHHLTVAIETANSGGYEEFSNFKLRTVPYAKYAENVTVEINDLNDAIFGVGSLFLGNGSGTGNSSGDNNNTAVGKDALHSVNTGIYNTAMGYHSLYSNTTGGWNVSIGNAALENNQDGDANIAIGTYALQSNITGNNNIAIGNEAGNNALGSGNVFIGSHAGSLEAGSNKLYIDNSDTSTPLIKGDFATDEVTVNGKLQVTGKLTGPDSGNVDMKAYAYGEFYNGAGRHLSENVTITPAAAGEYNITFNPVPGGSSGDYIVIASIYSGIGFCEVQKSANYFIVKTYDAAGNQESKNFTFVMYKK